MESNEIESRTAPSVVRRFPAPLLAITTTLIFLLLMTLMLLIGHFVPFTYGDPKGERSADTVLVALVYASIQKIVLLTVLLAILYREWGTKRPMSKLLPIFCGAEMVSEGYFSIIAARSLDILGNGRIDWGLFESPTAKMMLSIFLVLVPVVDMVFIAMIARGYKWSWGRIIGDFIILAAFVGTLEYLIIHII